MFTHIVLFKVKEPTTENLEFLKKTFLSMKGNIAELNENEWVTIRGSLSFTTINDDDGISHRVPVIIIDNLTKNNKVENKS